MAQGMVLCNRAGMSVVIILLDLPITVQMDMKQLGSIADASISISSFERRGAKGCWKEKGVKS